MSRDNAAESARQVSAFNVALLNTPEAKLAAALQFVADGVRNGTLHPHVGKRYPLAEANEALRDVVEQTGGARGKIILTI